MDALGGEMGINIDKTFIQSKMLNTSKGPAVHSLRAQADKEKYHQAMLKTIEEQENLDLIEDEVTELLVDNFDKNAKDSNDIYSRNRPSCLFADGNVWDCNSYIN